MYQRIINKLKNNKVAILGFGKEGISTYNFIRRHLKDLPLTIIDGNEQLLEKNPFLTSDNNVSLVLGKNFLEDLEQYDYIIKSPGVPLKDIDTTNLLPKLTSQIGLILEDTDLFVIGITASKGKTTTTSLIYKVLSDQGKDAYLLGNMGNPPLDEIEKMTDSSILVIEMAALQLEYVKKSPRIGCVLNLFEEHLDFFGSAEPYYQAKINILRYQTENDYAFYCEDNKALKERMDKVSIPSSVTTVKYEEDLSKVNNNTIFCASSIVYIKENDQIIPLYDSKEERQLLGNHNLENIMVVLGISRVLGLDLNRAKETINHFETIEHRMEKVGTYNSITYYNDSIATIPEATIHAIEALKTVNTLIFGGKDRGISYDEFALYLENSSVENLICMPDTGTKIGEKIKNKNVYFIDNLEEAVALAKKVTKENTICLMSPAAASYNQFKHFEEKGTAYKQYVKK